MFSTQYLRQQGDTRINLWTTTCLIYLSDRKFTYGPCVLCYHDKSLSTFSRKLKLRLNDCEVQPCTGLTNKHALSSLIFQKLIFGIHRIYIQKEKNIYRNVLLHLGCSSTHEHCKNLIHLISHISKYTGRNVSVRHNM